MGNLFTLCANHVANENLFFSTSHFTFLFLSHCFSLFFHLGFHRKCPAEQTNDNPQKKNAVKQHTKITGFTFSYLWPLMSFFDKFPSFSSKLFCFCFLRFFPKENIKENNSVRKKKTFQLND